MANRDRREALRGAEEETCDFLAEVLTPKQWAGLLKAPLELAAANGNRGIAQKLVGAGADIGEALHKATRGDHGDVVGDLLDNGASMAAKDTNGRTPLHVAARWGKTEMVQLLLLKGADKDAMDNGKRTPLYTAAWCGHMAAALALLAAGADVSLRCGRSKISVLHTATYCGHVEILRAVIEHGANVDAVNASQATSLHFAALRNEVEAIDMLVEAGADIEARDRQGQTPLYYAACQPNLEALLGLLRHGAHVNALEDSHRRTPLHEAAFNAGKKGTEEVADSLLRSGADETILDDEGKTAADVVGENVEEYEQLAEVVDRVRELLANAPADRAWRRRGYLVLCRAHPDRMRWVHESSSVCAGVARRTTRSNAGLARTETDSCTGTAGGSMVGGRAGGDWARLVARVLVLQEEGIFRTIVGYL